jgi:hypothetical protein
MPKLSDAEVAARVHAYPRLAVCQECAVDHGAQQHDGHMATWWSPGVGRVAQEPHTALRAVVANLFV